MSRRSTNIEELYQHPYFAFIAETYSAIVAAGNNPFQSFPHIFSYGHTNMGIQRAETSLPNISNYSPVQINTNRQFIKLEQTFLEQLESNKELFENQNQYALKEKMKLSSDILLNCYPDKISLNITEEGALFYTIIKDTLKIYFTHYLIDEFDDTDEAIVSVFDCENNIFNYGGTLSQTFFELNKHLSKINISLPQLV
jgi:hypothetical protein